MLLVLLLSCLSVFLFSGAFPLTPCRSHPCWLPSFIPVSFWPHPFLAPLRPKCDAGTAAWDVKGRRLSTRSSSQDTWRSIQHSLAHLHGSRSKADSPKNAWWGVMAHMWTELGTTGLNIKYYYLLSTWCHHCVFRYSLTNVVAIDVFHREQALVILSA